jgi:hypothetical protein
MRRLVTFNNQHLQHILKLLLVPAAWLIRSGMRSQISTTLACAFLCTIALIRFGQKCIRSAHDVQCAAPGLVPEEMGLRDDPS